MTARRFTRSLLVLTGVLGFAAATPAHAQAPLKVTSTIHGDGSRTDMQVDSDAHTAVSTLLDAAGKVRQTANYQLDDTENPISGSVFDRAGKLLFRSTYKRDSQNRVTEESDFAPTGPLLRRITYDYSADGKLAGIHTYDANGHEILPKTPATKDAKKSPPRVHR